MRRRRRHRRLRRCSVVERVAKRDACATASGRLWRISAGYRTHPIYYDGHFNVGFFVVNRYQLDVLGECIRDAQDVLLSSSGYNQKSEKIRVNPLIWLCTLREWR